MSDSPVPSLRPVRQAPSAEELRVRGALLVYRLHDVGYAIDLVRASALLAAAEPARARPARGEAQALQIANPPVTITLRDAAVLIAGEMREVRVTARLYDFGVCALRTRIAVPEGTSWETLAALGQMAESAPELTALVDRELARLLDLLDPAIERRTMAPVREDYVVFRVEHLADSRGQPVTPDQLTDAHLVPLLLGEHDALSAGARGELLTHRFAYYADELTVLTWDNALVVEPRPHDHDVEYIVEFANAQLLELRVYDALLDAELPAMYDQVAAARRRWLPTRRFRGLLAQLQTRVADITETVERAENALKVTDDVYLARIYAAALEVFRGTAWRRGVDRKLAIIRETYAMLNDEAQSARAELLELAVIVLILAEVVVAMVKGV